MRADQVKRARQRCRRLSRAQSMWLGRYAHFVTSADQGAILARA
jgi:hypothetical protein